MKKLTFLKAFNSPFKRPKLKWYYGKTAIGTPYFYPRKWVKGTPKLAHKAVMEYIKREESYNKLNPKYARKIKPYDEVYQEKLRYEYAVPKKIGFDFVGLGYKTKWSDTDYRFEWAPLLSFVFFGYQIAVMVIAPEQHHYWEAWLYYEKNTDKTKPASERIQICRNEFPLKCTVYSQGVETKVDYYNTVLKAKYIYETN
jgi:hypothetical protein